MPDNQKSSAHDKESKVQKGLLPKGLSDLLPDDAMLHSQIITSLMSCFTSLGYMPVKPPLVEFEEVLLADGPGFKLAEDTFRIMDPASNRMMALRSDMTAQIARIASTRLAHYARPLRLSYSGDVLRICADPLNPERQLTQVGAEMIGADTPSHDAELAIAALTALESSGVKDLTIDFCLPKLLPLLFSQDNLTEVLAQAVAAKDYKRVHENGGAQADLLCQILELPMVEKNKRADAIQAVKEMLGSSAQAMFVDLLAVVEMVNKVLPQVMVTIDPLESRGFDYHHGIGFTIFSKGVRGELGRGGRYRTASISKAGEDSTGVTLYLERVCKALPSSSTPMVVYIPYQTGLKSWLKLAAEGHICRLGRSNLIDANAECADAVMMGCTHRYDNGKINIIK